MTRAPVRAATSAHCSIWSRFSRLHGPAITTTASPPMASEPTRTMVPPGRKDAAGELVGRGDAVGFLDALHDLKNGDVEIVLAADPAEHGVDYARGAVHIEFQIHQAIDHVLDLLFGGAFLHDD